MHCGPDNACHHDMTGDGYCAVGCNLKAFPFVIPDIYFYNSHLCLSALFIIFLQCVWEVKSLLLFHFLLRSFFSLRQGTFMFSPSIQICCTCWSHLGEIGHTPHKYPIPGQKSKVSISCTLSMGKTLLGYVVVLWGICKERWIHT